MGNETFYRDGLSRLTDKRIPQKIRQEKDIISDPLKFWQKKKFQNAFDICHTIQTFSKIAQRLIPWLVPVT